LAAIELARELNREHARNLPSDAPDDFVPPGWRVSLYRDKEKTGHAGPSIVGTGAGHGDA
jgi:hypothetical protein